INGMLKPRNRRPTSPKRKASTVTSLIIQEKDNTVFQALSPTLQILTSGAGCWPTLFLLDYSSWILTHLSQASLGGRSCSLIGDNGAQYGVSFPSCHFRNNRNSALACR